MALNGNLRTAATAIGILTSIVVAAVGYGTLRADVRTNTGDIAELKHEVSEAKTNAGASAVGASLQAQINEVNRRLERVEDQNNEIIRMLRGRQ